MEWAEQKEREKKRVRQGMEWDGGGALEPARSCWEREMVVGRVAGDEDAEEGAGMGAGFQETSAGAFGAGGEGAAHGMRVFP